MAQREIREYDGKTLLSKNWTPYFEDKWRYAFRSVFVKNGAELRQKAKEIPWLKTSPLVVKPDMLFGKRGKNRLVYLKDQKAGDVDLEKAIEWIERKQDKEISLLSGVKGKLNAFIVEPFTPHAPHEEYYVAFTTEEGGDVIHISDKGGIDIEENWNSVVTIKCPVHEDFSQSETRIKEMVSSRFSQNAEVGDFVFRLYHLFCDLHFVYLELNPFVFRSNEVVLLDMVAKLDDTANFFMAEKWGQIEFPASFGNSELTEQEKTIRALDETTGASLKLSVLNPKGRIWTLVAGGGASVVYADTISDMCGVSELAIYGEYSGNPSTEETYIYTKAILELMTAEKHPQGLSKILLIGGAIANFTDVAKTFDGIIHAFQDYAENMRAVTTQIYVRRGGPNYEKGLQNIQKAAERLQLPIEVYGPKTHMTDIVRLALEPSKK